MNLEDFSLVEFPPINREFPGFVYVMCWVRESEEVPFYVGETTRIWGRLDDYYWAMFAACTDFRVGEAIRYLSTKGYRIVVRYKLSADPKGEESQIIKDLGRIYKLLNGTGAYNYQKADEFSERSKIHKFLDSLLPN